MPSMDEKLELIEPTAELREASLGRFGLEAGAVLGRVPGGALEKLAFRHPFTGDHVDIESPVPADFLVLLATRQ